MWRGYLTTAIYRDHLLRDAHPHEGRALWRTLATAKRLDKVRSRLVEVSLRTRNKTRVMTAWTHSVARGNSHRATSQPVVGSNPTFLAGSTAAAKR
jgi:hypothetical protein